MEEMEVINDVYARFFQGFYAYIPENEEVYIFIRRKGQVQIDGEVVNVPEGSILRISPKAERCWRNNSDKPLLYIIIQMRENSLSQFGIEDATEPDKPVVWAD